VKIHNFYGASECGGIAYDRTDAPRDDAALVGTPMNGVTIELSGRGCVTVRSAAVGLQYWPKPEPALAAGVYQSGDLGEFADGVLCLRGRASDVINVAGRKVVPEEVERVLALHPAVTDCLIFGVPAEGPRNEQVVGCVVCRGAVSGPELGEFLRAKLSAWQVPREWWFVDALEVNERGKRSRADCRARYLSGLSDPR
jgi:acyl-coenzyme A synthetase/AMP-(fatty) acid ligase